MRPFIVGLLFLFSESAFAQCKDSLLIKPWGKWNDLQYSNSAYRLEHHKNDSILPSNIREAIKDAILQRSGEVFYSKLKITDLSIVIPLREKQHADNLSTEGLIKKGDIKFYYSFLFEESTTIQYRFNIALDVFGNVLTDWKIPKLKEKNYKNYISFCQATFIGYMDKKAEVKKINDVSLMYDAKLNYFAWKITLGYKFHPDDTHYKSYRLTINYFTGEVIDRWDAEVKKYDDPGHKQ